MGEFELYSPMKKWLYDYMIGKLKGYEIIVDDTHNIRLDKALQKYNISLDIAVGIDIQIDVLGIARKNQEIKLFFIEAKNENFTLRDLGQLLIYCKLIDPEEAFLFSSKSFGSLNKILNVYNREDLLDFGNGKRIKKIKVAVWNTNSHSPDFSTMVPKL